MRAVSRSIVSSHFSIISTTSRIVSYRIKKWERQSHLSFEKSFENHEQRIKGSFVEQKSGIFLTSISGFFVMRNASSSLLQWVRLQPTGANTQVSVEIRENPRIVWTVLLSRADMNYKSYLFISDAARIVSPSAETVRVPQGSDVQLVCHSSPDDAQIVWSVYGMPVDPASPSVDLLVDYETFCIPPLTSNRTIRILDEGYSMFTLACWNKICMYAPQISFHDYWRSINLCICMCGRGYDDGAQRDSRLRLCNHVKQLSRNLEADIHGLIWDVSHACIVPWVLTIRIPDAKVSRPSGGSNLCNYSVIRRPMRVTSSKQCRLHRPTGIVRRFA